MLKNMFYNLFFDISHSNNDVNAVTEYGRKRTALEIELTHERNTTLQYIAQLQQKLKQTSQQTIDEGVKQKDEMYKKVIKPFDEYITWIEQHVDPNHDDLTRSRLAIQEYNNKATLKMNSKSVSNSYISTLKELRKHVVNLWYIVEKLDLIYMLHNSFSNNQTTPQKALTTLKEIKNLPRKPLHPGTLRFIEDVNKLMTFNFNTTRIPAF